MANDERERGAPTRVEAVLAFAVTAAVVVLYALRGATYDVVPRGESAIVLWWALALGFASGRLPRARLSWPARAVMAGFALLVGWTVLAFNWTDSDERTSVELARTVHHAGLFVAAACLLRRRTVPAAVAGVATAAVAISALSVVSRLWPVSFPVEGAIGDYAGNRLQYPLNYWNAVGGLGAMATALALAWSAHARTAAWRVAALVSVPVCVVAVYLTYSRSSAFVVGVGVLVVLVAARTRATALVHALAVAGGSFLAIRAVRANDAIAEGTGAAGRDEVLTALAVGTAVCALVAVALALLKADRRLRLPRRHARIAEAIAVAAIVIAGIAVLPPVVAEGWDQFKSQDVAAPRPDDPAARLTNLSGGRAEQFESALRAYRSDPLNGTGPGTFEFWWNRDAESGGHIRDVHSLYLEALAELGWPGLLFVLVVCGGAAAGLVLARVRARDATEAGAVVAAMAAFAVWLVQAGVDWMWEETVLAVVALVAAGAGCAALGTGSAPLRAPLRVALALLALLAVGVQISPTIGTSRIRESQRAIQRDDPRLAREAAVDAVEAWPWAASPYVQRALVSEAAGDLDAARVDLDRAIAREPVNWRPPLLLARIEARRGRPRAALAAFRRARELRPRSDVFRTP
jgi:tetratricopeptide (TPR) repeat protein